MSVAVLVMTDGRHEYLRRCLDSLIVAYRGPVETLMHDDTGDEDYRARLAEEFPTFTQLADGPRRGFGGAIRHAWTQLRYRSTARFVFHVEADFLFQTAVNLDQLAGLLAFAPHLAQVALKRQPWGGEPEGGFMAQYPGWYTDRDGWVETTRNWTTNPCLYRRDVCYLDWPDGPNSEGIFGFQLRAAGLPWGITGNEVRFGFLGHTTDPPWVIHIGHERVGTGY